MTLTTRTVTRESDDWPTYAPSWAMLATIEHARERSVVTFERCWTMPGQYRDMEPLPVVRVVQEWDAAKPAPEPPRVAAGPGDLWVDWRAEDVARALREIADALDPSKTAHPLDTLPTTEQEGEDG
ncbi:MAG TPA: hypothetical protein VL294_13335 [Pseudolysinimonas sp.]|jgi:hypothetical protein|nr:hypothetical protein [Pseudolysinimonas sp.]